MYVCIFLLDYAPGHSLEYEYPPYATGCDTRPLWLVAIPAPCDWFPYPAHATSWLLYPPHATSWLLYPPHATGWLAGCYTRSMRLAACYTRLTRLAGCFTRPMLLAGCYTRPHATSWLVYPPNATGSNNIQTIMPAKNTHLNDCLFHLHDD